MDRRQSLLSLSPSFFFASVSANTDFGDEAYERRGEMILKSRELEGSRDSGFLLLRQGPEEGKKGTRYSGLTKLWEACPEDLSISFQNVNSSSPR